MCAADYSGMAKQERPLSVSVLTRKIDNTLAEFGPLLVQGELSQVKISANGHLYATLKDSAASISAVMWRSTVVRQKQLPEAGTEVLVRGSLSVYGPRGQYQLTASSIRPVGHGDLAAALEELRQRLEAEGLFDPEHKQHLPFLPRAVGIVTASGSAALADMLHGLAARFPDMRIIHAPAQVQGRQAKNEICAALAALDRHPDVDVIICGRGGGSLEDLWNFNDEMVVRAIWSCATPVVSAVGHETDVTLADLVADVRAKTPTAAADLVVPEQDALHEQIEGYQEHLQALLSERLSVLRQRWQALAAHRALSGPGHQLMMRYQRLDECAERLQTRMRQRLLDVRRRHQQHQQALRFSAPTRRCQRQRAALQQHGALLQRLLQQQLKQRQQALAASAARLEALSPLAVLQRGYAVLQSATDQRIIHDAAQLHPGDLISARLAKGRIAAEVREVLPADETLQPEKKRRQ